MTAEHFNCWWTHTPTPAHRHTHTHTHAGRKRTTSCSCSQSVRKSGKFYMNIERNVGAPPRGKNGQLSFSRYKYFSGMYKYFALRPNKHPFLCAAGCLVPVMVSFPKTVFYCWRFSETVWSFSLTFDSVNRDGRILLHINPSLFVETRCCCVLSPARSSSSSRRGGVHVAADQQMSP